MKRAVAALTFLFLLKVSAQSVSAVDFAISNPQVTGDTITFDTKVSDLISTSCPTGKCYFQGGIRFGTGDHFGFTKNNSGDWVGYVSSPTENFIKDKFLYCEAVDDSCEFAVSMRFNHDDPNYEGPGDYKVKLIRYSGNSTSGADSEPLTIALTLATPTPTATPSPTPSPSPSPSPTPTPTAAQKFSASMGEGTKTATPTVTPKTTTSSSPAPAILGDATEPPRIVGAIDEAGGGESGALLVVAIIMLGMGVVFVVVAGVSIWTKRYNENTPEPLHD